MRNSFYKSVHKNLLIGLSAGCPSCRCGTAAINATCDSVTGECACAPGAAPPSCDTCLDEHYGLNTTGCLRKYCCSTS